MEEKKKRFRPSLTAYRALENEVSELREQLSLSEQSRRKLSEDYKCLRDELQCQRELTAECIRARDRWKRSCEELVASKRELSEEIGRLRSRSLWQRILNR